MEVVSARNIANAGGEEKQIRGVVSSGHQVSQCGPYSNTDQDKNYDLWGPTPDSEIWRL